MRLLCLCPTYGHPRLLANSLACFLAQDHPDKRLLILDDADQFHPARGADWELVSLGDRFPSLPAKYDYMLSLSTGHYDAVVVWDDDDIYLPWHLSAIAESLSAQTTTTRNPRTGEASAKIHYYTGGWAHPREVWSLYTGRLEKEPARGRFHGSLAVGADLLKRLGGWRGVMPEGQELRADFDQRMIAACGREAGPPQHPDWQRPPSYVYRWGSTQSRHCSALMTTPDDQTWYGRYGSQTLRHVGRLVPAMDAETRQVYEELRVES